MSDIYPKCFIHAEQAYRCGSAFSECCTPLPEHNTMAAYDWIRRGEKKELKTNSGRQRLNLHGAIHAETHEITVIESPTVNKDSTLQLFEIIK